MTDKPASHPYHYREDVHAPRPHQGRLICNKCSLDMSLPVHPVVWPCEYAETEEKP